MVARAQVLARARLWPAGSVAYQQWGAASPTGHRPDCSGYVSMCWDLPTPGENTVTLVTRGVMAEIPREQLQPGDAVGMCGPGTAGDDGHVQLVEAYDPQTGRITVWEQTPNAGPTRRTYKSISAGYRAYRYAGITPTTPGDDVALSDADAQALIWRVEAILTNRPTVAGGPTKGEPNRLAAALAAAGVVLSPADLATVAAAAERGAEHGVGEALDGATVTTTIDTADQGQ